MATYNSNLITTNTPAKQGVYPLPVSGTVLIPAGTTLANGDTIPLFNIGTNTYIANVAIDIPVVGSTASLTLRDTQATPLVYVNASNKGVAGGIVTTADFNVRGSLGFVYTAPSQIVLASAAAGGTAVGPVTIYFVFLVASI
jgi:hypothetical protein